MILVFCVCLVFYEYSQPDKFNLQTEKLFILLAEIKDYWMYWLRIWSAGDLSWNWGDLLWLDYMKLVQIFAALD